MKIFGVKFFTDDPSIYQMKTETPTVAALNAVEPGLGQACLTAMTEIVSRKLRPLKITYLSGTVVAYGKASQNGDPVASSSINVIK